MGVQAAVQRARACCAAHHMLFMPHGMPRNSCVPRLLLPSHRPQELGGSAPLELMGELAAAKRASFGPGPKAGRDLPDDCKVRALLQGRAHRCRQGRGVRACARGAHPQPHTESPYSSPAALEGSVCGWGGPGAGLACFCVARVDWAQHGPACRCVRSPCACRVHARSLPPLAHGVCSNTRSCTWAACRPPSLTSSCRPCLSRLARSRLPPSSWTRSRWVVVRGQGGAWRGVAWRSGQGIARVARTHPHRHRHHPHAHACCAAPFPGPQGASRCFGFVHFEDPDTARTAATAMSGKPLEGRPLVVRVRSDPVGPGGRPLGGGMGGGGGPPHHVSRRGGSGQGGGGRACAGGWGTGQRALAGGRLARAGPVPVLAGLAQAHMLGCWPCLPAGPGALRAQPRPRPRAPAVPPRRPTSTRCTSLR